MIHLYDILYDPLVSIHLYDPPAVRLSASGASREIVAFAQVSVWLALLKRTPAHKARAGSSKPVHPQRDMLAVIVVPLARFRHWQAELARWAPQLSVGRYDKAHTREQLRRYGVVQRVCRESSTATGCAGALYDVVLVPDTCLDAASRCATDDDLCLLLLEL